MLQVPWGSGHVVAGTARLDLRPELAEFLGVFFLLLAGGGAILVGANSLAVALAFGFAILVLISALGHVSGAHFNPAITLAFAATRHFPWRRVPTYLAAQFAGALVASALLAWWHGDVDLVVTEVRFNVDLPVAIAIEVLGSFLLALVIVAVATDPRAAQAASALAIGLTVTVNSLWAGPLTGAGTNPARSLGPALVAGQWADLWLYLAAPAVGSTLAMMAYQWMRGASRPQPGESLGALGPVNLDGRP